MPRARAGPPANGTSHTIAVPLDVAVELWKIAGRLQAETGVRVTPGEVIRDLIERAKRA